METGLLMHRAIPQLTQMQPSTSHWSADFGGGAPGAANRGRNAGLIYSAWESKLVLRASLRQASACGAKITQPSWRLVALWQLSSVLGQTKMQEPRVQCHFRDASSMAGFKLV